jgi:uncharacterized protein YdiU (UPF0061 family)
VREALGASQKETAKLEEILHEKKAEFEAAFKDMQERHENALDKMKEAADQAAEECEKSYSEANRKLERVERQSQQEIRKRDDVAADLDKRNMRLMEQLEPAEQTIASQKKQIIILMHSRPVDRSSSPATPCSCCHRSKAQVFVLLAS